MGSNGKRIKESFLTTVVIILGAMQSFAFAQSKVNIMLFYEDPYTVKSFDAAVEYAKENPALGISIGEIWRIRSNGTDGSRLITSLCKDIDAAYMKPSGKQPDIIVDFTRTGLPSEAVKLITKVMSLPTISGSFGQEGDIRSWRDLTENAKNYLIQIAPPADMVPQAVRSIVSHEDMTNAVFLFDDEYEMQHKNNSLLQDMPTRHLLGKLRNVWKQIESLDQEDFDNIFVAASPNEISAVLSEASDLNASYFSNEHAWYTMSMEPGFPKCYGCKQNASVVHLTPILFKERNERWDFLKVRGIFKTPRLMDMFYFDLTMDAIGTVAKMKYDNTWIAPPRRSCKDIESLPDDQYNLPLFEALKDSKISEKNLLGPFHLDEDKTMGRSFANFQMAVYRVILMKGKVEPESMQQLAVWTAGLGEKELIMDSENINFKLE